LGVEEIMSMTRTNGLMTWLMALPLAGCLAGGAEQGGATESAESSSAMKLFIPTSCYAPPMPESIPLEKVWPGLLWPDGTGDAATIIQQSLTDETAVAYGVDITNNRVFYQIPLRNSAEYSKFLQISNDVISKLKAKASWGIFTQIVPPLPPQPDPVGKLNIQAGNLVDTAIRFKMTARATPVCSAFTGF
jgi:hypothetical protein